MFSSVRKYRQSLVAKVILTAGLTLVLCVILWAYFNIRYHRKLAEETVVSEVDRLSTTIKLGTHYAMMLDSEEDIQEIIQNISRQPQILTIRIYNKSGSIKFSNDIEEIESSTHIKEEACWVCHVTEPPLTEVSLQERTRLFQGPGGARHMGIMSPIYNEPGCEGECHVHPPHKKILGLLDVVFSLEEMDKQLANYQWTNLTMTLAVFLATFAALFFFIVRFVNRPIRRLMKGTRQIARGGKFKSISVDQQDEVGELAEAINRMGREVMVKHSELNEQKRQYQTLFEGVPCIITVQDRDYKLVSFNREFSDRFDARVGDYCFKAYKGLKEKCEHCPVEKTFADGLSHYSEEKGLDKDGTLKHWIVTTSPIRDEEGKVVAAMEMCLDITPRKRLEEQLEISEHKYHAIFTNIPHPVFVLDSETLDILNMNDAVATVYGYMVQELMGRSFLELFNEKERDQYARELKEKSLFNQATQITRQGASIYVSMRVSPSDYPGGQVLLVTTTDITQRLEAEQQLIQASKMATLGEMATGVAHELNQPLTVLRTISGFFRRRLDKGQSIDQETLLEMSDGIAGHVERAAKIINHMREFGRKSDIAREPVQVNQVLEKAFDLFSRQLALRDIAVHWDLDEDLPRVMAEANRLEQVFINLLINARDAIEEACAGKDCAPEDKRIDLRTRRENGWVIVTVRDTGTGVPAHLADKLFEPFFTTKEVGKGTGLGLSISFSIIKDYDGEISARNSRQGGAVFDIRLPVA